MDNTLPPLKRIAAIHDLSGLGKCSLTVALPVISATGVECACIPTAVLSTHTGEFTGWTFRDLSDDMLPIAHHWQRIGARIDGIYSGYLASPGTGAAARTDDRLHRRAGHSGRDRPGHGGQRQLLLQDRRPDVRSLSPPALAGGRHHAEHHGGGAAGRPAI